MKMYAVRCCAASSERGIRDRNHSDVRAREQRTIRIASLPFSAEGNNHNLFPQMIIANPICIAVHNDDCG